MKNIGYIIIFLLVAADIGRTQVIDLSKEVEQKKQEEIAKKEQEDKTSVTINGDIYDAIVTDEGDTLILANIDDISITSIRTFDSPEEKAKYDKFRRYALKVYPYAREAIRIFREVEYATEHLSRRERRRKIKALEKELTTEFEKPLRMLTKLQGKIMLKMIEKETGRSTYDMLKDIKGRFRAFYWNQFSKLYSYNLSEGYQEGKYKVLDAVLQDFDVSHRIENDTNLKYFNIEDVRK